MRRMYSKKQLEEAKKPIDSLVGNNGENRFIEGEINLASTVPEGLTKIYGKWSLCGTHLMLVLCLNATNGTAITESRITDYIPLPSWILDRIYPVWSTHIIRQSLSWYASNSATQVQSFMLDKTSSGLYFYVSALTLNTDKAIRVQFDLLIDDE